VIERIEIFVYTWSSRWPPSSNRCDTRTFVRSTVEYKAQQHWPNDSLLTHNSYTALAVVQATKPQWRR